MSGDVSARLDQIQARADAATKGPWEMYRYKHGGGRIHLSGDDGRRRTLIADMEGDPDQLATVYNEADREFLFAAIEDVPALVAAVRAVLDLAEQWANQPTDYDEDTEQQIEDGKTIRAVVAAALRSDR